MPTFRSGLLAAACVLTTLATPGLAQEHRSRGNDACTGDAAHVCKKFFGKGDGVILQCFQQNRSKLSTPCCKFLAGLGLLG